MQAVGSEENVIRGRRRFHAFTSCAKLKSEVGKLQSQLVSHEITNTTNESIKMVADGEHDPEFDLIVESTGLDLEQVDSLKKGFEGFDKEGAGTITQTTMQVRTF